MAAELTFDFVVIGGGSGGSACARRAAGYGAKVIRGVDHLSLAPPPSPLTHFEPRCGVAPLCAPSPNMFCAAASIAPFVSLSTSAPLFVRQFLIPRGAACSCAVLWCCFPWAQVCVIERGATRNADGTRTGAGVGGTCVNVGCVPKKIMWMVNNNDTPRSPGAGSALSRLIIACVCRCECVQVYVRCAVCGVRARARVCVCVCVCVCHSHRSVPHLFLHRTRRLLPSAKAWSAASPPLPATASQSPIPPASSTG